MASEGGNSNGGTSGTGTKSEQDPKEGKRFFNFVFNVNKKITDETEMTQDFMNDLKHYQEFDETVTKCAGYLENVFIPYSSKGSKPEEEAFTRLATALGDFKSFVPQAYTAIFENFSTKMKAAGVSRKCHQALQAHDLRHMKKFHTESYEAFVEQRKKFDESRKKMDQAKADVRDAKTTTAIEKKAICYQLTVDDFDQKTEELIKIIEALPKVKQEYVRDIYLILSKHKQFHADMSKFFAASCVL